MRLESSNTAIHRKGIEDIVYQYQQKPKAIWNKIAKVYKAKGGAFERVQTVAGFGAPAQFEQGDVVPEDELMTPYTMDVTAKLRGIKHSVSQLAAQSDIYGILASRRDMMGKAMLRGREVAVANIFNNATSTSAPYVLPDTLALISTAHTLASGTQSNRGVASSDVDLSYSNLQSMIQELMDQSDHRGGKFAAMGPFRLIVAPSNAGLANILADKTGRQPQTANNDMNWAGGQIAEVVVNPYCTDADAFFIQDIDEHGQRFCLRLDTQVAVWQDPDTANSVKAAIWEAYTTFSRDWRGLQGSPGA